MFSFFTDITNLHYCHSASNGSYSFIIMIISLGFIVPNVLVKPNHSCFEDVLIDSAVNTNIVTTLELRDTFQLPYLLQYLHSMYIILFHFNLFL